MNALLDLALIIGMTVGGIPLIWWHGKRMYQQGLHDGDLGIPYTYQCSKHGTFRVRVHLGDSVPEETQCRHESLVRLETFPVQHRAERCGQMARRTP